MEILQRRLRKAREVRKLSQITAGDLAGCGQQKICAYEAGKTQPKFLTLIHLTDALQVSTDYLLGRTDEMERKIALEDVLEDDEIELILKYRSLPKESLPLLLRICPFSGQNLICTVFYRIPNV